MDIRPIDSLTDSPLNTFTEISEQSERDLEEELKKGQHSSILVFDSDTQKGEILGGKHRVATMKRMGYKTVKVISLSAGFEDGQGYYAIVDGETVKIANQIPAFYPSIEHLKIAYMMSHNHSAIHYNGEKLVEAMGRYQLEDWNHWRVPLQETKKVKQELKKFLLQDDDKPQTFNIIIQCPDSSAQAETLSKLQEMGLKAKAR